MGATGLQARNGRAPRCHGCGFDLTGLPSVDGSPVRCPECGAEVTLELAYSTQRERLREWLQEPAEPTPARFALTTFVMTLAGAVALLVVGAGLYLAWLIVARALGP